MALEADATSSRAYLFGFRDITGVELNPAFVDFLTNPSKLRSYAGVADLPNVHLVVDEGRSWFARTQEKFDTIQMSMIDTFASTGAGAFSLSENGLYTVEGWRVLSFCSHPHRTFHGVQMALADRTDRNRSHYKSRRRIAICNRRLEILGIIFSSRLLGMLPPSSSLGSLCLPPTFVH